MLEYKQKRNNGRTPFAGVYKFVSVCVCELEVRMVDVYTCIHVYMCGYTVISGL